MALTQTQLLVAVADRAEFTKADTKRVLDALEAVVLPTSTSPFTGRYHLIPSRAAFTTLDWVARGPAVPGRRVAQNLLLSSYEVIMNIIERDMLSLPQGAGSAGCGTLSRGRECGPDAHADHEGHRNPQTRSAFV
jgi:hypothetical protein